MKSKFRILFLLVLLFLLAGSFVFIRDNKNIRKDNIITRIKTLLPSPTPKITLKTPVATKVLENSYHIFQRYNNCGPASLSMALSYYGINKSQEELGEALRPYQVASGDNDDKSVTLEELAAKASEYGLTTYHLPNGSIEKIKLFITYDIPIITRTWLHKNEDIGHYRLVKGYNDETQQLIQDDSFENKNLWFSYSDFNEIWKKFNYEYLVLVPSEKKEIVEEILGEDSDPKIAWEKAVQLSQNELSKNPDDVYARFNLSIAYYNLGEYKKSTDEFEKIEDKLSSRTLWYQIEPIQAYYELGNYDRVFEISDRILNNENRAFSELYILKGNIYLKQENKDAARAEFEKAVFYNKNLKAAQAALASVQ